MGFTRLPKPTRAELELLQELWPLGAATAKQAHAAAQGKRPEVSYATVLRLMQIMHGKGLLIRDKSQKSHVYAPVQTQESVQSSLVTDMIQRVFAGSTTALVRQALRSGISKIDRDEIEKILKDGCKNE